MAKFGAGDDRRGAYIAGSSGSSQYRASSPEETESFRRGVQSSQGGVPEIFQDKIAVNQEPQDDDNSFLIERERNTLLDDIKTQDDAFALINALNEANQNQGTGGQGILNRDILNYIKEPLVGLGAFTTDPNEQRNVYQLLVNKMFQGDNDRMRGALPLNQGDFAGLRRTGPTSFVDPSKSQGFLGDLFSLYTGENKAAVNASDFPGGGIAELPNFGQAGLDFTKEQGFKDYGRIIEGLITAATPLKYGKMLAGEAMGGLGDLYNYLYPNRRDDEDELDTLIDSIDEEDVRTVEGDKKKRFFFF